MVDGVGVRFCGLVLSMCVAACADGGSATRAPRGSAGLAVDAEALNGARGPDIALRRVSERVWLHESAAVLPDYGRVQANGLMVVGRDGAVIIDSAWTEAQTRWLIDRARAATGKAPRALLATHFHDDRAGGIAAAREAEVPVYASTLTRTLLGAKGVHVSHPFASRAALDLGDVHVEVFFPGAGHSPDNVVVYVAEERLLFGGCLVRAGDTIGNVQDADVGAWPAAMEQVIARYPNVKVVVPGHGATGDGSLLTHTRELALAARRR